MKIKYAKEGVFIPEWKDNRDLEVNEQIKINFEYVSSEIRGKYIGRKEISRTSYMELATTNDVPFEIVQDGKGLASECVKSIDNLTLIDPDGKEEKIITWDQLVKAHDSMGLSNLVAEISNYFVFLFTGLDSKN